MVAAKRRGFALRRKNEGFTQELLAAALEIDRTTVQRWESGECAPQPWMRPRLAKTLQVTITELEDLLTEPSLIAAELDNVEPANPLEGGDEVLRRELLAGVLGVAGYALLGKPEAQAGTEPMTVAQLRILVDRAQSDYLACRYQELSRCLPGLIRTAQITCDAIDADQRLQAEALLATTYRHATWLALRLGEDGLACGLSEQAMAAARKSGDLLVEAEVAQMGAVVLRRFEQSGQAQQLVVNTADKIDINTRIGDGPNAAAYAMLLETGAYTAAIAGNRVTALDLHAEAVQAARSRTPGQPGLAITPSGVDANYLGLYGISVHRKLGDYGTAINAARAIHPNTITVLERRVRYWEDVALTFGAWGKRKEAFQALLAAERLAPQEVRLRPWAHRLTTQLRSSGPALPGLKEFAKRSRIA
ncbi:helix-turn-helix transcriptional regulator [Lentzea flaviverrucosa]|uniref:Helix-turn-helix domain-containing protein n=1 Tax=Lentzea flaviverrucosa TaxID=200379 RepID=A0A1H9EZB1_9PSEU|nr:helix-turn-helix transcriptional regulator [Lentzea flaviverrucosa]RDI35363.1 helix-turn-helix protein [Lentzea flaviverrucosa]SEQ30553.1 Helix-turn-helix domain-containing protein [Lentzea flaviverrucosa]